jgi:hypothetical protein
MELDMEKTYGVDADGKFIHKVMDEDGKLTRDHIQWLIHDAGALVEKVDGQRYKIARKRPEVAPGKIEDPMNRLVSHGLPRFGHFFFVSAEMVEPVAEPPAPALR